MNKLHASLAGEMKIIDKSGHKQLTWHEDAQDEIAVARNVFDYLVERGYSAFGSEKALEPKHLMRTFDPTMEEVIMVPRNVSG